MDDRQALIALIERYYQEVVYPYKETTTNAMEDARKLSLFKKRDFGAHIRRFQAHMETAEAIDISQIEPKIPGDDVAGKLLADQFSRSRKTFLQLCEANIQFYRVADKKQYRGSGIVVKEFKAAAERMQEALKEAVLELELLDKAYQKYAADEPAEKDG